MATARSNDQLVRVTEDLNPLSDFIETKTSLKKLQEALHCHKCQSHERLQDKQKQHDELLTLGVCEHRFCRSCVTNNQPSNCPVCSVPYRTSNVHIDKQLSNIAVICTRLADILDGKPEEKKESHLESMPNDDVGDDLMKQAQSGKSRSSAKTTPVSSIKEIDIIGSADLKRGKEKTPTPQRARAVTVKSLEDSHTPKRGQKRTRTSFTKIHDKGSKTFVSQKELLKEKEKSSAGLSDSTDASVPEKTQSNKKEKERENEHEETIKQSKINKKKSAKNFEDRRQNSETKTNCRKNIDDFKSQAQVDNCSSSALSSKRDENASFCKGNQPNLEKKNAKGETSLQVAALKANLDKVRELLKAGANPNVKDNAGWTPLHEAVNHGNAEIAKLLLDHGASVNTPGLENETPLHDAVSNYRLECVSLLVERGANVMARNTHGHTPLDLAKTEEIKAVLLAGDGVDTTVQEESFMDDSFCETGKMCFTTSILSKEEALSVQDCVKLLNTRLVDCSSSEVTHTITSATADGLCPRSLKYLNGLLSGSWIVSVEWINACLTKKKRVPEETYELRGCVSSGQCGAPQKARLNRMKQLPGLFDGCQFFFQGKFTYPTPSKEELIDMARLGGGAILTREPRLYNLDDYPYTVPYHASAENSLSDCAIFVIFDNACQNRPTIQSQRMSYLPVSWFLDSIASFSILEKTDYLKQ